MGVRVVGITLVQFLRKTIHELSPGSMYRFSVCPFFRIFQIITTKKKDWLDTLFDKRGHANRKLGHLALFAVEEAKGPAVLGKRPRAHPEARPTCPTGSPCSSASLALGA